MRYRRLLLMTSSSIQRYIRRTCTVGFRFSCKGVAGFAVQPGVQMAQASSSGRGSFIVFEGLDRCGKTTQCSKLLEYLQSKNITAELWRFPDRTAVTGSAINSYLAKDTELSDEAVHLLFSANRWEKKQLLLDKLNSGTTLVVDRYAFSGVAYSVAKHKPGLTLQWCKAPDQGLPAPDKVLYMHMSPEASARRGGYGGERYEKQAFQEKVGQVFSQLRDDSWKFIDADRTIQEVHTEVVQEVEATMAEVASGKPLTCLWDQSPVS